jgi:hypothetical protein
MARHHYIALAAAVLLLFCQFAFVKEIRYISGDLIFISNPNVPDKLLQAITKSKYSHVGIVVREKGRPMVYYAANVVKKVTVPEFAALSVSGKYEVMRVKDTILTAGLNTFFAEEAKKLLGFPYDTKYSWLDKEMYSTELVWKIFKRATHIELCEAKIFNKLVINDTVVRKKIKVQMGDSIPDFTKIVSPSDLYNSPYLVKIN